MESTENVPADTFQSASTVVQSGSPETHKSKPNVTFKPTDDDSSVKGQGAKIDKVKSEHSPDNCESAFFTPSGSFEGLKATNSPLSSISETESQDRQAKGTGSPQEMAEMSESPRRLFGRTRHKSDGSSPAEQRDVLASVQEILVEEDRDWKRVRKSWISVVICTDVLWCRPSDTHLLTNISNPKWFMQVDIKVHLYIFVPVYCTNAHYKTHTLMITQMSPPPIFYLHALVKYEKKTWYGHFHIKSISKYALISRNVHCLRRVLWAGQKPRMINIMQALNQSKSLVLWDTD